MTFVMHNTYGYSRAGRYDFYINRFLRIYPTYWFSIILSLAIIFLWGSISGLKNNLYPPGDFFEWFQNLFLVFSVDSEPRLSPASWALTVELFFYVMIGLGLSRTREMTKIWFIQSVIYTVFLLITLPSDLWYDRYFPIPAASLPFSIGAMLFHYREKIDRVKFIKFPLTPVVLMIAICLNFAFSYFIQYKIFDNYMMGAGLYVNLLLMILVVVSLNEQKPVGWLRKVDVFVGKFSYPMYLCHWQGAAMIYLISGQELRRSYLTKDGLVFLVLGYCSVLIISYIAIKLIDEPVERWRRKFKRNASAKAG